MTAFGRFLWFATLFGSVLASAPKRLIRKIARKGNLHSVVSGGRTRAYYLHVPRDLPSAQAAPLVLVFHGGFADGLFMEDLTGFNAVADRERFVVAYPNGIGKHWNDGRTSTNFRVEREQVDDVGFVVDLLEAINRFHPVDPKRVYATGLSNGAAFSHYLAARLARRIAAIAPVVGGIAEDFAPQFQPEEPVPVCVIQGTADPLIPWEGGPIRLPGNPGTVISTEKAVQMWIERNRCATKPEELDPPDNQVRVSRWPGSKNGAEVLLYAVKGGGHTWPGGPQYLPERIVGKVCRGFNATEAIWNFFKEHPKL